MTLTEIDAICSALQNKVFTNIYGGRKPNSFEPWREPGETLTPDGMVCLNDICYSNHYPNSFFDLWMPNESREKRPVFVYLHGGGFLFGDKSKGDPLAAAQNGSVYTEVVKAGYSVVNADYCLAPEYRSPAQIRQLDELLRYLIDHAQELSLDMSRVCLAGSSAGAVMAETYAATVCNADYARQLGFTPVLTSETLKVVVIDESATDSRTFDDNLYTMMLCCIGDDSREYQGKHILLNAVEHIQDRYIPAWINTSNRGSYFIHSAQTLAAKLEEIGVAHDMVYFTKEEADLDHGYMELYQTNPFAREALDRMLKFVKEHL